MSKEAWLLLLTMRESQDHGAFAVACDGKDRAQAHELEELKLADWRGTNWGSSFWAITDEGRNYIRSQPSGEG